MMRYVNDNELVNNSYSLTENCNLNVVEPERACDMWSSILNLEYSKACLVDSSLTGDLRVRILG